MSEKGADVLARGSLNYTAQMPWSAMQQGRGDNWDIKATELIQHRTKGRGKESQRSPQSSGPWGT